MVASRSKKTKKAQCIAWPAAMKSIQKPPSNTWKSVLTSTNRRPRLVAFLKLALKVSCDQFDIQESWMMSFAGNNMFCDYYNSVNRTYCKRLRVLCPEHCKDPKISEHEVCGCPLVTNVFSPTGDFCRAPKKSCTKHYVWEKLRRAEVSFIFTKLYYPTTYIVTLICKSH